MFFSNSRPLEHVIFVVLHIFSFLIYYESLFYELLDLLFVNLFLVSAMNKYRYLRIFISLYRFILYSKDSGLYYDFIFTSS